MDSLFKDIYASLNLNADNRQPRRTAQPQSQRRSQSESQNQSQHQSQQQLQPQQQSQLQQQPQFLQNHRRQLQVEDAYDLVLNCDSLRDLNSEGWKLTVTKQMEEIKSAKCVSVSGGYNSGKTFIVNGLADGLNLRSGFDVHTEGLSIKKLSIPNVTLLFLDTAGSNSPIKVAEEQALSDKICAERILNSVLLELADFHICVVNQLTWADQRHFEELTNQIQLHSTELPAKWPLFVVHNFRERGLNDLKQVLDELKLLYPNGKLRVNDFRPVKNDNELSHDAEQLLLTQVAQITHERELLTSQRNNLKPNYYQFWFDAKDNEHVRHVFLVKNDGNGKIFNSITFEYIRQHQPWLPDIDLRLAEIWKNRLHLQVIVKRNISY